MLLRVIGIVSVSGEIVHRDVGVVGVEHSVVNSLAVNAKLSLSFLQLFMSFERSEAADAESTGD